MRRARHEVPFFDANALVAGFFRRSASALSRNPRLTRSRGHWLYEHPQVRLSAHISWSSLGMLEAMSGYFLDNLGRYVRNEPRQGIVDLDEGY